MKTKSELHSLVDMRALAEMLPHMAPPDGNSTGPLMAQMADAVIRFYEHLEWKHKRRVDGLPQLIKAWADYQRICRWKHDDIEPDSIKFLDGRNKGK